MPEIRRIERSPIPIDRLECANFEGLDLQRAMLQGETLRRATFRRVNLRGALLEQADLIGAKFIECNLINADLTEANLTNAEFESCNLLCAYFAKANMSGTKLRNCDLTGKTLGADKDQGIRTLFAGAQYDAQTEWPVGFDPAFHGAGRPTKLWRLRAMGQIYVLPKLVDQGIEIEREGEPNLIVPQPKGAVHVGVDWHRALLQNFDLRNTTFRRMGFRGIYADGADFRGSTFTETNFINAHLDGANLAGATLDRCCLIFAMMAGTDLRGTDLSTSDFTGVTLEMQPNADVHIDFRGALYDNQTRWPEGFEPSRHGMIGT